jgi:hypothetical protein
MSLLDGQYLFRGLLFGNGTPFGVRSVEGLEDLAVRAADRELPRGHGSVTGPHYAAAKNVVLELKVAGEPETVRERLAELREAFTVTGSPEALSWLRAGRPERLVNVSPLQFVAPETPETLRLVFPKVALTAADPRIYSAERHQLVVSRYDPAGGSVEYPVDYPKDFPAGGAASGVVFNAGASDAYPLLRFYGPKDGGTLTSVTLRNTTTGQALTVATSIGPGQILTVDNTAHVTGAGTPVVSLDGASRYGSWRQPRVPFSLPPGESTLRYETEGTTADTECVVTWRDTWIQ